MDDEPSIPPEPTHLSVSAEILLIRGEQLFKKARSISCKYEELPGIHKKPLKDAADLEKLLSEDEGEES